MPKESRLAVRVCPGAISLLARALGVSRAGLARRSGVSESTLYRIDAGEPPGNVTIAALLGLAHEAALSYEEILLVVRATDDA